MKPASAILIIGVLLVSAVIWLGRYEVVPVGTAYAYRLDRWSGEVRFYDTENWVVPSQAPVLIPLKRDGPQ